MSSDQLFEIEKEYDARYEGLDFDDVDERPLHLTETQEEGGATQPDDSNFKPLPPPPSQQTDQDIEGTIENLERAEALEEEQNAQKQPKTRIIDRLEGKTNTGPTTAAIAAPLASSQLKLANALVANTDLTSTIHNPFLFVAALTLELIPEGTSKSTVLAKLATALRCLKTATSEEHLFKSLGLPESTKLRTTLSINSEKGNIKHADLSREIKHAFELADTCKEATSSTPQLEEQTVRALLKLATAPVTANLLSECDQAGKQMRKLKNHPVQAVAQTSEAVVKAWKQTLTSPP
jgi:hypothetical protein